MLQPGFGIQPRQSHQPNYQFTWCQTGCVICVAPFRSSKRQQQSSWVLLSIKPQHGALSDGIDHKPVKLAVTTVLKMGPVSFKIQ